LHQRSPRTLAGFKGPITKRREERKGEEIGEKEEGRGGKRGEKKGRQGRGGAVRLPILKPRCDDVGSCGCARGHQPGSFNS